jgi:hypothetical protein
MIADRLLALMHRLTDKTGFADLLAPVEGRPVAGAPEFAAWAVLWIWRTSSRWACCAISSGWMQALREQVQLLAPSRPERSHPRPAGALDMVRCPRRVDPFGGSLGGDSGARRPRPCGAA